MNGICGGNKITGKTKYVTSKKKKDTYESRFKKALGLKNGK